MSYASRAAHLDKLGGLQIEPVFSYWYREQQEYNLKRAVEAERGGNVAYAATLTRYATWPYYLDQAGLKYRLSLPNAEVCTAAGERLPIVAEDWTVARAVTALWRQTTRRGRRKRNRIARWVEVEGKPFPYVWDSHLDKEKEVRVWDFFPISWDEVAKPKEGK